MGLKSLTERAKEIQGESQIWICKITPKNKTDTIEDWNISLMKQIKDEKHLLKELERNFDEIAVGKKVQNWICMEDKKNRARWVCVLKKENIPLHQLDG